ncbi:hypothetical protein M513_02571, partial [Trichuris suis]
RCCCGTQLNYRLRKADHRRTNWTTDYDHRCGMPVVKCDDAVVQNVLIDKRGIEKTALFTDESTMVKVMRNSVDYCSWRSTKIFTKRSTHTRDQRYLQRQRNCSMEYKFNDNELSAKNLAIQRDAKRKHLNKFTSRVDKADEEC